jgi:hypothetical protein
MMTQSQKRKEVYDTAEQHQHQKSVCHAGGQKRAEKEDERR